MFLRDLLCPWDSPGRDTGVGCHSLLQGTFLTQRSKLGLLHGRQILYHLSHQGSELLLRERDNWGVWDGHEHTAIFKMDNQ